MNVQRLNQALGPYLPTQAQSAGVTAQQLQSACQRHVDAPDTAPHPYAADLAEKVQWSRDLGQLAGLAQASFPAGELRLGQLREATEALAQAKTAEADESQQQIADLKHAYWGQVGWTAGWMGVTLGALAVTGVLPNPITAAAAVGAGGMCIRAIVKARGAAQALGNQVPALETAVRTARQVAGDASSCAPLVGAWNDLLDPPQGGRKAA